MSGFKIEGIVKWRCLKSQRPLYFNTSAAKQSTTLSDWLKIKTTSEIRSRFSETKI